MGKRGDGYGSEDHLLRLLTDDPPTLNMRIAKEMGVDPAAVYWLDSPKSSKGSDREFRGLEFLRDSPHERVLAEWSEFWPTTGRQQTWDAVGKAGEDWLLVEAKANWPESVALLPPRKRQAACHRSGEPSAK